MDDHSETSICNASHQNSNAPTLSKGEVVVNQSRVQWVLEKVEFKLVEMQVYGWYGLLWYDIVGTSFTGYAKGMFGRSI